MELIQLACYEIVGCRLFMFYSSNGIISVYTQVLLVS